jgi:5-formyltetrahydrofolate cyclo-ligase
LRAELLARRRAVPEAVRAAAGREVARHLASLPDYLRCRRLVAYSALPDELPLDDLVARAVRAGKHLLWPRVLASGRMTFAAEDRVESLVPGRYGVREPAPSAPSEALGSDALVLVPGVAFDASGGRLGRGKGLWDRALGEARGATVVGVGYELQWVEWVPREPHDRLVEAVLTEAGIRRCGGA